jgi:hypothetical protein
MWREIEPESLYRNSGACQSAYQQHDGGNVEKGLGGGEGRFEVAGEPPVATEPSEGALEIR